MTQAAEAVQPLTVKNPYKFLAYFSEEDQPNFAGRNREIQEVVTGILTTPTFVLYGRSGLGKTSLLQAGIFPELRNRRHRPIYIRTLIKPVDDLCQAVAEEFKLAPALGFQELRGMLKDASKDNTLVLILDQFEEFFIRFQRDQVEYQYFIKSIASILSDNELKIRVVFSLREDYLAQLEDFTSRIPGLFNATYRLMPLSAYGTRRAVSQPLINAHIRHQQKLIVSIVDQLDKLRFDPPLLQVICTEIYRESVRRDSDNIELRVEDLEKIGGVDGIFRRYLNGFIQEVPYESHLVARTILDALITQENTKQAVTLNFFQQAGFEATEAEITTILELLVRHSLVRKDKRGKETWYELLHERLVDMIVEWLELDQDFFRFRFARDFIANCAKGEVFRTNYSTLLNEGQIRGVVRPYRERLKLSRTETEFMAHSVIYSCRKGHDLEEDVRFWCERLGNEESCELVISFFGDEDESARLGAASSCQLMTCTGDALPDRCLGRALYDPSLAVRQAASDSFALLAQPRQLKSLEDFLRVKKTRPRALQILADLYRSGHSMGHFNWFWRRKGKTTLHKRVLKAHQNDIRARGRAGALAGFLSGLVWSFTIGLGLTCLVMWALAESSNWVAVLSSTLGTMLPIAMILGTGCGYANAKKVAKASAKGYGDRWFRTLLKPGIPFWIVLTIVFIYSASLLNDTALADEHSIYWILTVGAVLAVLPTVLFCAIFSGLVGAVMCCLLPGVRKRHIWIWSFLFSLGIPMVLSAIVLTVHGQLLPHLLDDSFLKDISNIFMIVAVVFAPLFSFMIFTVSTALAFSVLKVTIGQHKPHAPKKRWTARTVAVLACVGFTAWYAWFYGFDTIPFVPFARSIQHLPGKKVELKAELGPGFPDTDYYAIPYITGNKVIKLCGKDQGVRVVLNGKYLRGETCSHPILIDPGFHHLGIMYDGPIKDVSNVIKPVTRVLDLTIYEVRPATELSAEPSTAFIYMAKCRVKRPEGIRQPMWTGTIKGQMASASLPEMNKLFVYIPELQWGLVRGFSDTSGKLYLTAITGTLKTEAISADIEIVKSKNPTTIGSPFGTLTPDPSGAWELRLNYQDALWKMSDSGDWLVALPEHLMITVLLSLQPIP